jgi:23S rRNA (uracil1939-C5)-methyltransferase
MDIRDGMELELAVTRLALGGRGVARVGGLVVFVEGGLPGATVRARIERTRKGFAEAVALEEVVPSPQAVAPVCRHFGVCGGCVWQNLEYSDQLFWKREQVAETLTRLGGLAGVEVAEVQPSPRQLEYRNKMEFAFAGKLHLGLHERRRPGRVLDIEECRLMGPWAAEVVAFVREFCRETGLPAHDARTGKGAWRHLVLRESAATGARLVHLITGPARGLGDIPHSLGQALLARFPGVTGFVHSTRRAPTAVAAGERRVLALGETRLEETVGEVRLAVSPDAFVQVNTEAAAGLYALVAKAAGGGSGTTAWDLYCGCGGIALTLAANFDLVHGVEADPRAIEDAREAAVQNGRDNCLFHAQDAAAAIAALAETRPDTVVLDPPRNGAAPEVLAAIASVAPARLVYVSCNPATLARDLKILSDLYRVDWVAPVDLFPHTPHIECVAALVARGAES